MNQHYPIVQETIRNYSEDSLLQLISALSQKPGADSQTFGCPANYEYTLKRFIGAALSKELDIKFNAFLSLKALAKSLTNVKSKSLFQHVTSQSNYNKHCEGKPSEIEAYIIGRILIVKALKSQFAASIEVIANLSELMTKFAQFQEQIIELIYELCTDKKSILQFSKINPTSKAGFLLWTILLSKLKKTELQLNQAALNDVLIELSALYPKRSICLNYVGPEIKNFIQFPASYLEKKLEIALGNKQAQFNIKDVFYILQLLQSHLRDVQINQQNLWQTVSPNLLGGWLLQLKVQNKHIRKLAQDISIKFEQNSQLALKILIQLHQKQLYLQNINNKHPLFPLYQTVEPHKYIHFLLEQLKPLDSENEQEVKPNYNQLEFFIVQRHQQLNVDQICSAIILLVNKYHSTKQESQLQAVNTIFNALIPVSNKKNQSVLSRTSLILSKLKFESLELGENVNQIKTAMKDIRSHFKQAKQEKDTFNNAFNNFILSVGCYFFIYPEQADIYGELQMVQKDIRNNILFQQSGLQPKKKRKTNEQEKNKPIHVLIDIFISLLTKSPQFLRTSINHLFEQIIPYLDSSDISHLLEVIEKPDIEYVQDYQNE